MKLAVVLLAVVVLGGTGARREDLGTPLAVLKWAAQAPLRTDYEAVQVLTTVRTEGTQTTRVAVWHRRPHAYRLEFLAPARLAGRLLVDDGASAWHYEPSLHLLVEGPSMAGRGPEGTEVVPEGSTARLLGTDVVVGRPAYLVTVATRSGTTRRLWVDHHTGLVLKSEVSDPERGVYVSSTFTRVAFEPVPPELFQVPRPRGARVVRLAVQPKRPWRVSELSRAVGFAVAVPAEVPAGFRYQGGAVASWWGIRAALLQYTDGVSWVSLFQVPAGRVGDPPGGEPVRVGPVSARWYPAGLFRVLSWERGGVRFAAVGDVAAAVLRAFVTGTDPNPSWEARQVRELARKLAVPADRVAALRDRGFTFPQIEGLLARRVAEATSPPGGSTSLLEQLEHFQGLLRRLRGAR